MTTPSEPPSLPDAIAAARRPPTEYPSVAGYYVVHESLFSGVVSGRPQVLWHNGRDHAWRINGSNFRAACWYGPFPELNRKTGGFEWPRSTNS